MGYSKLCRVKAKSLELVIAYLLVRFAQPRKLCRMATAHGNIRGCSSQAEPNLRRHQTSGPPSDQQFPVAVEDDTTNNIRKVMSSAWICARPICRPSISDLREFIARAESCVPFRTKTIAPCREWFNRILRSKSCICALSDSFVDMLASLRSFDHMRDLPIVHIEISLEVAL